MRQSGGKKRGVILNITSIGRRLTAPGRAFYHASKFALEGFTESVRKELRPEWNVKMGVVEMEGIDFLESPLDGFGGSLVY